MSDWLKLNDPERPAPRDRPILIACFRFDAVPVWCCQAEWTTITTGHIQRAAYSGWMPDLPMQEKDGSYGRAGVRLGGIIHEADLAPTHWAPIPALPPPPQESER